MNSLEPANVKEVEDVEVTRADQDKINAFGRLNTLKGELEVEMAFKKKLIDSMDDAEEELMMGEDEEDFARIHIGEAFLKSDTMTASDYLEEKRESVKEEIVGLESRLKVIRKDLEMLKKEIKASLGDAVNLEER
eukprot:TRINITY_DN9737_c0_g1_i1.p1 TRINITY_DN9737_c0_g1~~TRINITY_DN9737_c0_g1_i1.p1  ORF type:complete len:135 (+),score=42.88 TRINITY_DN9737_c0_g1_i1:183-587(+)